MPRLAARGIRWLLIGTLIGAGTASAAAADPNDDQAQVGRQMAHTHAALEVASARAAAAAVAYTTATQDLVTVHARLVTAEGVLVGATVHARTAARAAA